MLSGSSEYGRKLDLQFFVRMMSGDKTLVLQANIEDTVEHLHTIMRKNKVVVNALVLLYAYRIDDHAWLLKHKDVLDFESRRHLALLMLPNKDGNYEQFQEMLINRSQLLAESFEYIYNARPSSLQAGLFMEFKNEEAKGPGVLREWFCLVCQALFDPRNALFLVCPLDQRSHFHYDYVSQITFHGLTFRVLMFALNPLCSLQAGRRVSLEDIKDADPCIYKSCQQILEMDPEFVDSDALCLTFVTETEELGSREVTELCSGGKDIIVNSKNRKEYVDLIVQQRFVTSISEQVSSFGKGFADILRDNYRETTFFGNLELKDLDWMLHGSERHRISVRDWKKHTQYVGYTKSDPEIVWFWKVVKRLNREQKKTLLFFWTSIKYLPVEGFRGLATKLSIYKSSEPQDRLPSSKTCFYRLFIPVYPTKAIMKDRLRVITQEHLNIDSSLVYIVNHNLYIQRLGLESIVNAVALFYDLYIIHWFEGCLIAKPLVSSLFLDFDNLRLALHKFATLLSTGAQYRFLQASLAHYAH
ncbi:E3 ubiquitin-protein ligase UPL5-like [Silene latifolia]|uniref:E3 ubiquitin-protein ligase UPL5-like n=1 Tax=Silene latifolia TaxID=37657 RepID=UPI003D77F5D5